MTVVEQRILYFAYRQRHGLEHADLRRWNLEGWQATALAVDQDNALIVLVSRVVEGSEQEKSA